MTLALRAQSSSERDWRTAGRPESYGQAPVATMHAEAIVQVYASRTFGWRGAFADPPWLAAKPAAPIANALRSHGLEPARGRRRSSSRRRAPDAEWYGSTPRVIRDVRGADDEDCHRRAARRRGVVRLCRHLPRSPGPNSKPSSRIWPRDSRAPAPEPAVDRHRQGLPAGRTLPRRAKRHRMQLSWRAGRAAGDEGFELNVLGLVTGVDLRDPALRSPASARPCNGWRRGTTSRGTSSMPGRTRDRRSESPMQRGDEEDYTCASLAQQRIGDAGVRGALGRSGASRTGRRPVRRSRVVAARGERVVDAARHPGR